MEQSSPVNACGLYKNEFVENPEHSLGSQLLAIAMEASIGDTWLLGASFLKASPPIEWLLSELVREEQPFSVCGGLLTQSNKHYLK